MEISHDGQFLFTVNTGSGSISRYAITSGGVLTLWGSTPVGATGGVARELRVAHVVAALVSRR